jgi:hypothetical protein
VPPNYNVGPDAGSVNFTVTSNTDWTVTCNAPWCNTTIYGSGNGYLTAAYEANTSVSTRIATITVTITGQSPIQVTVTQSGIAPLLSVIPPNQDVAPESGTTDFTVTSNSDWTAVSNAAWCTPTPSGTGNGTLTANYTANGTYQPRIATIDVSVSGLPPVQVTVTQDASTVGVPVYSAEKVRIYPNPTKGIFNILPAEGEVVQLKVTVQDLNGKNVLEREFMGKKEYQVDLSSAPDGTYNILINTGTETAVRKLVLLK